MKKIGLLFLGLIYFGIGWTQIVFETAPVERRHNFQSICYDVNNTFPNNSGLKGSDTNVILLGCPGLEGTPEYNIITTIDRFDDCDDPTNGNLALALLNQGTEGGPLLYGFEIELWLNDVKIHTEEDLNLDDFPFTITTLLNGSLNLLDLENFSEQEDIPFEVKIFRVLTAEKWLVYTKLEYLQIRFPGDQISIDEPNFTVTQGPEHRFIGPDHPKICNGTSSNVELIRVDYINNISSSNNNGNTTAASVRLGADYGSVGGNLSMTHHESYITSETESVVRTYRSDDQIVGVPGKCVYLTATLNYNDFVRRTYQIECNGFYTLVGSVPFQRLDVSGGSINATIGQLVLDNCTSDLVPIIHKQDEDFTTGSCFHDVYVEIQSDSEEEVGESTLSFNWSGPNDFISNERDPGSLEAIGDAWYHLTVTDACDNEHWANIDLCPDRIMNEWILDQTTGQYCRTGVCTDGDGGTARSNTACDLIECVDVSSLTVFIEETLACETQIRRTDTDEIIVTQTEYAVGFPAYDPATNTCQVKYFCDPMANPDTDIPIHTTSEPANASDWELEEDILGFECLRELSCNGEIQELETLEPLMGDWELEELAFDNYECYRIIECDGTLAGKQTIDVEYGEDWEVEENFFDFECIRSMICDDETMDMEDVIEATIDGYDYDEEDNICNYILSCDGDEIDHDISGFEGDVEYIFVSNTTTVYCQALATCGDEDFQFDFDPTFVQTSTLCDNGDDWVYSIYCMDDYMGESCGDGFQNPNDNSRNLNTSNPISGTRVFPNPSSGDLYIESIQEILSIELLNMNGQSLKSIDNLGSSYKMDISLNKMKYPKGMYHLKIQHKNGIDIKKIIID